MTVPGGRLDVPLAYPVFCRPGALSDLARIVALHAPAHHYAVVTDDTIGPLHAAAVYAALPAHRTSGHSIPAGECQKTRARWLELTDALLAAGAGRDTTVIALGGGVIGDLAGFVAATFMRGVGVVQIPTTLLAMVDASVGGKTGVDTPHGKNLVGAFHDPRAVVIDPAVLTTLPDDAFRSGLAEVIKHGVLASADYFDATLRALPAVARQGAHAPALAELIAESVRIKARVVAEDGREAGLRHTLNFGHTIGHAVETLLDFRMLHGDAVAIGMVAEAQIAESIGVAVAGTAMRISDALRAAALPTELPAALSLDAIVAATRGDKKNRAGLVRYALPVCVGQMARGDGTWSVAVEDGAVRAALG